MKTEEHNDRAPDAVPAEPYRDNAAYLAAELGKLDALLRLRLAALGRAPRMRLDASGQGHFVSHEEVDRLLDDETPPPRIEAAGEARLRQRAEALSDVVRRRTEASLRGGVFLGLPQLRRLFGLSPLEAEVILVCLAPELRRRYDVLYAFLQDDIARKRPSVDLALELLCPTEAERWRARALFAADAPLLRCGILRPVEDPASPSGSSGLARFLRLDPRILHFVLGHATLDRRLLDLVRLAPASDGGGEELEVPLAGRLVALVSDFFSADADTPRRLVIHLHGPYGAGKRELVAAVCGGLGCELLTLDAGRLLASEGEAETLWRLALRESVLRQAPLCLEGVDALIGDQVSARLKGMEQVFDELGGLLFLTGRKPWAQRDLFPGAAVHSIRLARPSVPVRERVWRRAFAELAADGAPEGDAPGLLAQRFRLTPGQIRDAVVAAERKRTLEGGGRLAVADLAAACRDRSVLKLGELALKIDPRYRWRDLVLPADKRRQLEELGAQVKHHYRVWGEWGFGDRISHGKGLSALFSGPPGTGKTMAAEVLAGDLGLDLYKIDLSRVVSKYIGETEKNLGRIFAEAEQGNVILFFDEADALFGKRTEISDAHDRYANIETSYLLQKMEEHDGVVILASNLRQNMDDAFLRRIRHVVEFPFPDAASRLEIWRTHFPRTAPVDDGVDCQQLAEGLQVAGGNIRNIVVNAAFFAAADGGVIAMEHVLRGARREFEKIGKLWDGKALFAAAGERAAGR